MKKIFGLLILLLIFVSASGISESNSQSEPTLEGTWELISFYNYDEEGNISDTVPTTAGYRQIKMYYNGKVMWTRYVPTDSVEWFGYGSYSATENSLTETLEYMSASMTRIADTLRMFNFELDLNENSYSQITIDDEGKRSFSENYKRLD